jgi:hypothetical protein
MVGTAAARVTIAMPVMSACFDADPRVLTPDIFSSPVRWFAPEKSEPRRATFNSPKGSAHPIWLAEAQGRFVD